MAKSHTTIPVDLIPKFEEWGKLTAEIFGEMRIRGGIVPDGVPEDQKWFWTKEWQKMEQEADEDITNGDYVEFEDMNEAINYLKNLCWLYAT